MFEGESSSQEHVFFQPDVVDKFLDSYYDALTLPLDEDKGLTLEQKELKIKQNAFFDSLTGLDKDFNDPLTKRVYETDATALYFLLTSGEIDILVDKEMSKQENLNENPDQIRARLVNSFLEKARDRNQEIELGEKEGEKPLTLGLEFEFQVSHESDRNYSFVENLEDRQPQAAEAAIAEISDEGLHNFKRESAHITDDEDPFWERVTEPSLTPQTQLREQLYMRKSPGSLIEQAPILGVHETYGNVELSPEHLEAMDLLAIEVSAGLVEPNIVREGKLQRALAEGKIKIATKRAAEGKLFRENYTKLTQIKGECYYFPFHRGREGEKENNLISPDTLEMVTVDKFKQYPREIPKNLVEKRTVYAYDKDDYIRMVKELDTSYLGMKGIQAVQTDQSQRTDIQEFQAESWNDLNNKWRDLLTEYGIEYPQDKHELFLGPYKSPNKLEAEIATRKEESSLRYNKLLSEITLKTFTDPEFRQRSYKLVINYRKQIRASQKSE